MPSGPAFNVSELIDKRPVGAFQVRIVALCTLVALLDGLDLQSIGLAAPGIMADLHFPPAALGVVFSVVGRPRPRCFRSWPGGRSGGPKAGTYRRDRVLRFVHDRYGFCTELSRPRRVAI